MRKLIEKLFLESKQTSKNIYYDYFVTRVPWNSCFLVGITNTNFLMISERPHALCPPHRNPITNAFSGWND